MGIMALEARKRPVIRTADAANGDFCTDFVLFLVTSVQVAHEFSCEG